MDSYTERVRDALALADPADTILRVKAVVNEELRTLDRRMRVESTSYFNHSFGPDLVMRWSDPDGVTARERFVFLRLQPVGLNLADDIERLEEHRPIFFSVHPNGEEVEDEAADLSDLAQRRNTLVTNASGVESLVQGREEKPLVNLASASIAQGGRGLVDAPKARHITEQVETGWTALKQLEADSLRPLLELVDSVLSASQADHMNSLLQALWIGWGGDATQFPGQAAISGHMDDDTLVFLLSQEEIGSRSFWRRVGRSLTLEQLIRIHRADIDVRNLQHIVRANHDRLMARACRVRSDQAQLEEKLHHPYWALESGTLVLRGIDFAAHLGTHRENVEGKEVEERDGVALDRLRERADEFDIPVDRIRLAGSDRRLNYQSTEPSDVIHDDRLPRLQETLGAGALVETAEALLPGDRELRLDFKTLTSGGRTRATFPLEDIVSTSLALMWDLEEEDWEAVQHLFPRSRENDQALLFDPKEDRSLATGTETPELPSG